MENTNAAMSPSIAGAVALIQEAAAKAVPVQVVDVEGPDGSGGTITTKVAILPGAAGELRTVALGLAHAEGANAARELRLLGAAGPDRRQGTAAHQALGSFIDHAHRFRSDNSAIWADPAARRLVSILDYHPHGADSPARWGKHRGTYVFPLSEAWTAWGGVAGLTLNQEAFAELLDRRDRELATGNFTAGPQGGKPAPPPADLITLAANLETYCHSAVKRERDPSSQRVKLTFTEEKGVSVAPPAAFLVTIPIFQDAAPQTLEVRLRVTVEDGKAKFQLRIQAAAEVLLEAFENLAEYAASETKLPLFIGTPEA